MWRTVTEPPPSRVQHYLADGHLMLSQCWCRPFLQNRTEGTTVMHNASDVGGLMGWPFASQTHNLV